MKEELENQIYRISPVFFQEAIACRNGKMNETTSCMAFGLECGDGWFGPLKKMAMRFHLLNETSKKYGLEIFASQIKEKWGELCVYTEVKKLNNNVAFTDETIRAIRDMAHLIICDAVKECNNVCEECGCFGELSNPIIQTSGWISYICQNCAIEHRKSTDVITDFTGAYSFLSLAEKPSRESEYYYYKGDRFKTFAGAYYSQLKPEYQKVFASLVNPYDVFNLVNIIMTEEEKKDVIAVETMKEILHEKFSKRYYAEQLLKTGNKKLVFHNKFHDNFWGKCVCDECKHIDGENILGKMLMNERNNLL